jgi:hypothetical protein
MDLDFCVCVVAGYITKSKSSKTQKRAKNKMKERKKGITK